MSDLIPKALDRRHAEKVLRAAFVSCANNQLTQELVAAQLGVSQSQVSRLLRQARERHWLIDQPQFAPPPPGSPYYDLWREVESRFVLSRLLEEKFRAVFGSPLRRVIVIDGLDEAYFAGAARALLPLLASDESRPGTIRTLGITWGRTIRHIAQALPELVPEPIRANSPLKLVPLCGEPFHDRRDPQSFSSSALVWELHRILNGPAVGAPLSIAGIYAFIPRRFARAARTIRDFYELGTAYTTIFGGSRPLAGSLDAILTAVGASQPDWRGIFLDERRELGDLEESEMDSILGDVSGILIPRRAIDPDLRRRIQAMNERWTGMKEKHLRACAKRSSAGPGVIVLAQLANRARLIRRCLELKIINTLIISRTLAEAIDGLIDSNSPPD